MDKEKDRQEILRLVREYAEKYHRRKEYAEGDYIPYASRVYDEKELEYLVDASLEFWLTEGRYVKEFERRLGDFLGVAHVSFVNSGSSANLLAVSALTSPLLGEKRLKKGDEVITVACGFPTTVAPIIQNGLVPVFVDVSMPEYNIDVTYLNDALSDKTRAIFLAHTLGNPFDIKTVKDFADRHGLWLIEDNCDALGSRYEGRYTGSFGHIATSSFYPAHHLTTGEGGAAYTNDALLHKIIRSLRDWGRECSCPPGWDNVCGSRFEGQHGQLPYGYDHKYVYSHFGYNLKATDLQAAIGVAQLDKLGSFIEARKKNFRLLDDLLKKNGLQEAFILPKATSGSDPSWFGYPLTLRNGNGSGKICRYLEDHQIQTRKMFAGNIIRHPCFDDIRGNDEMYRVAGELKNTDYITDNTFWLGVYPGMEEKMFRYIVKILKEAVNS